MSEGRISLEAQAHPSQPVPTLSRVDLYAGKLLANADRWADRGVASRDAIDLAMMIDGWGPSPRAARDTARPARADAVDRCLGSARDLVCDDAHRSRCLAALRMDPALGLRIVTAFERRGRRSEPICYFLIRHF